MLAVRRNSDHSLILQTPIPGRLVFGLSLFALAILLVTLDTPPIILRVVAFVGLCFLAASVRYRTTIRPRQQELTYRATRALLGKTRTFSFDEIADVIISPYSPSSTKTLFALTLVTSAGESLRLEEGASSTNQIRPLYRELRALLLARDQTPEARASSLQDLNQELLDQTSPASYDAPIDLRAHEKVTLPRRYFSRFHKLYLPAPPASEVDAWDTLLPADNETLRAMDFRYLGELRESPQSHLFIFTDPSATIIVQFHRQTRSYALYTYFDNASVFITWSRPSAAKALAHTAECVHQTGSRSLLLDVLDHGHQRNQRAELGIAPVQVSTPEEMLALIQLFYGHIFPNRTALLPLLMTLAVLLAIAFVVGISIYFGFV